MGLSLSAGAASLDAGFQTPPDSAKPYTWWHWMNGNVSKEGITKDLESMKAVGIGGFQQFDVGLAMENGTTVYNSKRWHEMMAFSFAEAERLGLDAGFNNCSGWSSSGGPWITPENSMKALIWTEIEVNGASGSITLEKPQLADEQLANPGCKRKEFYTDITILAFPTPTKKAYRLKNWKQKSLYSPDSKPDAFVPDNRPAPKAAVIVSTSVLNLSDKMNPDGTLNWKAPAGNWTVIRFGYTSTGMNCKPGSRGGIGLEIDKLSRKAADIHWEALLDHVIADAGETKAFTTILIDSYEVGMQNWTEEFADAFNKRRGYDIRPMLLCVTGRVLDSTVTSERVLWDLRTTVAELAHENYFGYFAEKCHEHGLELAIEPYGSGTFDAPTTTLLADLPMAEFWQNPVRNLWQWTGQVVPSGAHLSGRNVVGAEAFTSMSGNWKTHPYAIKKWGDWAFSKGINRYYFHTFTHQPFHDSVQPGMMMSRFGGNFHRNNTWFMKSKAWMDYIARCQFIMQSGTYQADVLALYGDERGFNSFLSPKERPDLKEFPGLKADLGGMSSLKNLSVDDKGDIRVTFEGLRLDTRYKILLLKRAELMLPENLEMLCSLADQGATIFAPQPLRSPTLQNYEKADQLIQRMIAVYWNAGKIRTPKEFDTAINTLTKDCEVPESILFNRHRIGEDDYYFIANEKDEARTITATFRVTGKQPEIWNPMTGEITDAANWKMIDGGRTQVDLELTPVDALFVVFRKPTDSKGKTTLKPIVKKLLTLDHNWSVTFDPVWGPKDPVTFNTLTPWNEHSDEQIKYYSGSATYKTSFELPALTHQLVLDLGQVNIMAKITLNGQELGTLWKPPFSIDISETAQAGSNVLEVEVTNLWVNRLIGDEQLPAPGKGFPTGLNQGKPLPADYPRQTFLVHRHNKKDDPLLPSGLLGPVMIQTIK